MTDRDFSQNMDDEPKKDSRGNGTLALGILVASMATALAVYDGTHGSDDHRRHFSGDSSAQTSQRDVPYIPRYPRVTQTAQPDVQGAVSGEVDVPSELPIEAPQSEIDVALAELTGAHAEIPSENAATEVVDVPTRVAYAPDDHQARPTDVVAPTTLPTTRPLPTEAPSYHRRPEPTPPPASLEAALEIKTTAQLLEELKNETGLTLVLPKDVYTADQLETYESYIDMQPSPADDRLKRIVAEAILGLPDELKKDFSNGTHTVVVQRVQIPEDAHFDDGQVISGFYDTDEDGISIIKLDAPAKHQYDAEKIEEALPSGLQPYEEVQFALYEYILMEHFLTDEGKAQISWFVADNAPYNELDYPTVQMLNQVLGFVDGSMMYPLDEIAARLLAWRRIGRKDILDKAKSITGLNLGNLPIY